MASPQRKQVTGCKYIRAGKRLRHICHISVLYILVILSRFDDLWRKFQTYNAGEELFGLLVTDYPNLQRTKKELNLLQKLYGLYNAVMKSINGYYDILWTEVDIDKINQELLDFQNRYLSPQCHCVVSRSRLKSYCNVWRCRKLPKGLKEWQAYNELKKKIDDFNESCPLLELMADKAMKHRHWERLENLTSYKFDIGEWPLFSHIIDFSSPR